MFAGVYVMELSLTGPFLLTRNDDKKAGCTGQAVVMVIITLSTVYFQYMLNRTYSPLLKYLPIISVKDVPWNRQQKMISLDKYDERRFQPLLLKNSPAIRIPRDDLGMSGDEIRNTERVLTSDVVPL